MQRKGELKSAAFLVVLLSIPFILLAGKSLRAGESPPGVSGEEIYGFARTQSEFGPRRPGTAAMDRARDHIISQLEEWGYKVWTDSIPFEQYFPERWSLEVVSPNGRTLESFPMWHSGPTGRDGLTAELVYVGKGGERAFGEEDVSGKVVLVSWGHRFLNLMSMAAFSNSYGRAIENGARGYIQFYTNTPGNSYQLVFADAGDTGPAIPGFSIGKEDAKDLKRLVRKGDVRVRMELESEEREALAQNIFAILPGRTEDIILVDTHYCSIFAGGFDNASGVASALALAKHFAMKPLEEREKTLVFTFYGSHEYLIGNCNQGSRKFLDENPRLAEKVVVAIGLDHMANYPDKEYLGHTTRIRPMTPIPGMDQPRGIFITRNFVLNRIVFPAVLKYRLIPFVVFPNRLMDAINTGNSEEAAGTDDNWDSLLLWCICESGPAYRRGVPTVRIMMAPQWYHTPMDTVDHFSPDRIKRAVAVHIEIIEKVDRAPPEKFRKKKRN
jgi:hypothetical protein